MSRLINTGRSVLIAGAVLSIAAAAQADTIINPTPVGTLATVSSFSDGNLTFSNFSYNQGTSPLAASNITIYTFSTVYNSNTETGLLFVGSWKSLGTYNQTSTIGFTVTANGALLEDDYLASTGSVASTNGLLGTANWTVDETVVNHGTTTPVLSELVNASTIAIGGLKNSIPVVDGTFPGVHSIDITKTITLSGTQGISFISDIYQGFSQTFGGPTVPLPLPLIGGSALLGGLFVGRMWSRRKTA